MMKTSVYLAGPITGLTWEEATTWRDRASTLLFYGSGITPLDPLRNKSMLNDPGGPIARQPDNPEMLGPQYRPQFIVDRDLQDVRRCSGAIINWRNRLPSVGTAMEIAMLWDRHKPMVFWGDMPDHAMVAGVVRHYYEDLESAVECLAMILGTQ